MPAPLSLNQIEPSDFTTTSLGPVSRVFWKDEARTVTVPSCSVRVSVRLPSSQVTSRPWRSRVLPSGWPAGLRSVATAPVISSQRSSASLGMSENSRYRPSP